MRVPKDSKVEDVKGIDVNQFNYEGIDDEKLLEKFDDQKEPLNPNKKEDENNQEKIEVPTTYLGQLWLVAKLSIPPVISMFFYMFV